MGRGLLCDGVDEVAARYEFIYAEKATTGGPDGPNIALMCRILEVSRSGYYAWISARPAAEERARDEAELVDTIRVLHAASRGAYGAPRVHAALARAGRPANHKRVEQLMRVNNLAGITRRRRKRLTRQAKRAVFAADLIGRDFTAPRAGMRMVGDITELVTLEGRLYLATCIDLATREVIGWAMADHHRAELPITALEMAATRGNLEPGCVMHTDRGSEYTSSEFQSALRELNLTQSMGRGGSCYDNAAAESWFALLKAEIGTTAWATRAEARADVFRFIEVEYNRARLRKHPEFGYITPLETRAKLQHDFTPAA